MAESLRTVLHVEDNDENRILVRRLLIFGGYKVVEADSAFQAISMLEKCEPDLILLDINMPDVDGYTLTMQLKSNPMYNHIPIVAITANALRGDRERTYQAGCNGYIEKPIDVDSFLENVESYIHGKIGY
jgi:two-component system, cell cycle response regulator DivK